MEYKMCSKSIKTEFVFIKTEIKWQYGYMCRWPSTSYKYTCSSQISTVEFGVGSKRIGLNVNSDKTEFMSFNQNGAISTLNNKCLKLIDLYTQYVLLILFRWFVWC